MGTPHHLRDTTPAVKHNLPLPDRMAELRNRINGLQTEYDTLRIEALTDPSQHHGLDYEIRILRTNRRSITVGDAERVLPKPTLDQLVRTSEITQVQLHQRKR